MNTRRGNGIRKSRGSTVKYGDSKALPGIPCRNYVAQVARPIKKLRELLCQRGTNTDGQACRNCEAACHFGKEYLDKKREEVGT